MPTPTPGKGFSRTALTFSNIGDSNDGGPLRFPVRLASTPRDAWLLIPPSCHPQPWLVGCDALGARTCHNSPRQPTPAPKPATSRKGSHQQAVLP